MMVIDDNEADDDITFSLCFCIPTIDDYDDDITFSLCFCILTMHHSMVSSADQLATPPILHHRQHHHHDKDHHHFAMIHTW